LRDRRIEDDTARLAVNAGAVIRTERIRRHMTVRALADLAGLGASTVHAVESGRPASLETYVRLAAALRLRPDLTIVDPRRRQPGEARPEDPVHAAMGEIAAAHFRGRGLEVRMDEPFQHYQFAGRADVVVWSPERAALLHIENRTQFPNLQAAFGAFNAKRAYLGRELAERVGIRGWRSETHVMLTLWSAEVLHQIRLHEATFAAVCPDDSSTFESWWHGDPPARDRRSTLLLFDPMEGARRDRLRWVGLDDLAGIRPRYRDYVAALESLKEAGLA
jgi:transcriptional regulator with XRE-family HTH domain